MGKINVVNDSGTDKLIYGVQYGYTVKNLITQQETPINVYPLSEFPIGQQIGVMFVDKKHAGRTYTFEQSFTDSNVNVSDDYGATSIPIYNTFDTGFTAVETDPSNTNIAWIATFNFHHIHPNLSTSHPSYIQFQNNRRILILVFSIEVLFPSKMNKLGR